MPVERLERSLEKVVFEREVIGRDTVSGMESALDGVSSISYRGTKDVRVAETPSMRSTR